MEIRATPVTEKTEEEVEAAGPLVAQTFREVREEAPETNTAVARSLW